MTTTEVIEKMKLGAKLFQSKSFKMSGQSFNSKVLPGNTIRYKLEDGTQVHHTIGNAMVKNKLVKRGESSKTIGGTSTELILA